MNEDRRATSKAVNQPQCTEHCGTKQGLADPGTLVKEMLIWVQWKKPAE